MIGCFTREHPLVLITGMVFSCFMSQGRAKRRGTMSNSFGVSAVWTGAIPGRSGWIQILRTGPWVAPILTPGI